MEKLLRLFIVSLFFFTCACDNNGAHDEAPPDGSLREHEDPEGETTSSSSYGGSSGSGFVNGGSSGSESFAEQDPLLPRDECSCDRDLGSLDETGSYPTTRDNVILIDGYGIYYDNCDIGSADVKNSRVNLSFDCAPEYMGNPLEWSTTYRHIAWISVRRTFTALQDLSCGNAIAIDVRSDGAEIVCSCSDGSEDSADCCFDRFGGLTKEAVLRLTIVDVTDASAENIDEETWWYDFPVETLGASFDWMTLTAPLDEFYQSRGAGTASNDDVLDLENVYGIEVNIAVTVDVTGGAICNESGCVAVDNYSSARLIGDLSFRNIRTSCE